MKRKLLALILAMCLLLPTLVSCAQIEDIIEGIIGGDNKEEETEEDDGYINNGSNIQQGTDGKNENTEEGKGIAKIEREGNTIIITYKDGSVERIEQVVETTEPPYEGTYEDIYLYSHKYIAVYDNEEMFRFVPEYSGYYEIYSYDIAYGDPYVYLYDAYGNYLASDDDDYTSRNFLLEYYFEAGETYYIGALANGGTAAYYFTIVPYGSTTTTEPTTPDMPESIYVGDGFYASVSSAGAYYTFVPEYSGKYTIYSYSRIDGDPRVYLYDYAGNYLADNDDGYGDLNFKLEYYLTAGEAYSIWIGVTGYNTASYYFGIEFDGSTTTEAPTTETTEDVTTETFETAYEGNSYYVEADYYNPEYFCFVPEFNGTYTIYSYSNYYGNPYAALYNSDWNYIVSDDNSNHDYNFKMVVDLVAGETYYIEVSSGDSYTASYYFTIEGMYTVSVDESIYVSLGGGGERFCFVPEYSGLYSIYSYGRDDGDPYVSLQDVNYNTLAYNNDGNGGWDFKVDYYLIAGETYYIYATTYDGYSAAYSFEITRDDAIQNIYVGDSAYARVGSSGVWYAFVPEHDGTYVIRSTNYYYGTPYVCLYDYNHDFITGNYNGNGDGNFKLSCDFEGGEVYYIYVCDYYSSGTECYFTIEEHTEEYEDVYLYDTIYVDVDSTGVFFRFIPEYTGHYTFYSYNNYNDTCAYLYDDNWDCIAYDYDSYSDGYGFKLSYNLVAGETYYIQICSEYTYYNSSCTFSIDFVEIISLYDEKYVSVNTSGTMFCFVPSYSGYYTIYSYNKYAGDPYATLKDAYNNQLSYDDDGNGNRNFKIVYYLTAGEVYYINVASYGSSASYYFTISY